MVTRLLPTKKAAFMAFRLKQKDILKLRNSAPLCEFFGVNCS